MTHPSMLIAVLILASCEWTGHSQPRTHNGRIAAATLLTERYEKSRLSEWNMRATVAGRDCDVLFINTTMVLDDALVEAIHYGAGAYEVTGGGVRRFCRDHAFRGVAYKDSTGRVWTHGAVTQAEAESLPPCR